MAVRTGRFVNTPPDRPDMTVKEIVFLVVTITMIVIAGAIVLSPMIKEKGTTAEAPVR